MRSHLCVLRVLQTICTWYGRLRVVMNGADRDLNVAISADGLTVQSRDEKGWGGARANCGFARGRHYFEATVSDEGLCRIGWSTMVCSRLTRSLARSGCAL
jgi:hypothetical protein